MKRTVLIIALVVGVIFGVHYASRAKHISANGGSTRIGFGEGQGIPNVALPDLNGKEISLEQYKGKVVLVNFWATWCEPCLDEIPTLIEMQHKYGPEGFAVLGIAMDVEGKSAVAPFVAKQRFDVNGTKLPMDYTILVGNEDAGNKFGGMFGLPTSVLIGRDGTQVKRFTGILTHDELAKLVETQLKKS